MFVGSSASAGMSDHSRQPDGLIILASGPSLSIALAKALDLSPEPALVPGPDPLEILAPPRSSHPLVKPALDGLIRYVERHHPNGIITVCPELPASRSPGPAWVEVPAPPGAHRFDRVRVPAWWSASNRRLLVTTLPGRTERSAQRPLLQLTALAHPLQRLAARLSRDHLASAAELASPWRTDRVVVVRSHRSQRLVIITRDVIAAELVWLALAPGQDRGPWEDPAVQRATSLDLGLSGPHQLRFVIDPDVIEPAFVHRLATALGAPLASVTT